MRSVASPWRIVGVCLVALVLSRAASAQGVFSFTPTSGAVSGGTTVVISGGGFSTAPLPTVTFGGVPGVVQSGNANSLTVVTPAFTWSNGSTPLGVNVIVTNANGSATVANQLFNYRTPST